MALAFRSGMTDRRQSFEREALPHLRELYAAAVRMSRNPRDAEDIVQETFLRAYAAWDRFIPGSNPRAWLFRILTNVFINGCRDRGRAARVAPETLAEVSCSGAARTAASDPESGLAGAQLSDDVAAALAELPLEYRAAVVLADLHDLSYAEIAESLGIPMGTVMSRLHRGRRRLMERLAPYARRQGLLERRKLEAA